MDPTRRGHSGNDSGARLGRIDDVETRNQTTTYQQRQQRQRQQQQQYQSGLPQQAQQQYLLGERSLSPQFLAQQQQQHHNLLLSTANRQRQPYPIPAQRRQLVSSTGSVAVEPSPRPVFGGIYNPPSAGGRGIGLLPPQQQQIQSSLLYSASANSARSRMALMTQQHQNITQQEQDQQQPQPQQISSLYPIHPPDRLSLLAHRERQQQLRQQYARASMPSQVQVNEEIIAHRQDLSAARIPGGRTVGMGPPQVRSRPSEQSISTTSAAAAAAVANKGIPQQQHPPQRPSFSSTESSSKKNNKKNNNNKKKRKGDVEVGAKKSAAAKRGEGSLSPSSQQQGQGQDDDHVVVPMRSSLGPDVKFLAKKRRSYDAESFPQKLYRMLDETEKDGKAHIFSFNSDGLGILIHQPGQFSSEIIPKYFRHKNLESFRRQFSMYGFQRIKEGKDKGAYFHQLFRKGKPELLPMIRRVTEIDIVIPSSGVGSDISVAGRQQKQG